MQYFSTREKASSPRGSRSNQRGLINLHEKTRLQPRSSWEGVFIVALWLLVCLFCSIDARIFVYLSLSQTLVSEVFILLLGVVAVCHSWQTRKSLMQSGVQYIVLAWGLYLLMHSLFAPQTEFYKLTYMEVTLTLLFSLPYLLRVGLLTQKTIERGWLLMLAVQLVTLLLQARGTVSSYNSFFTLTGCNENPNVTALLLVMVVPLLWERVKGEKYRILYGILLAVTLLFVVLLKCRTAYVGLMVMAVVHVMSHDKVRGWWRQKSTIRKAAIFSGMVAVLLLLGFGLYQMKQQSADGRLLVWKISARMVKDQPWGIGMGMFEHDYNLQQARYWSSGEASDAERWVSDTVYMAYNDYLEQGVETGVLGAVLLMAFYGTLLWTAYKRRNRNAFMLIAACSVMSCINFFYATIQPWIVLLSAVSMNEKEKEDESQDGKQWISKVLVSMGIIMLLYAQTPLLWSQFRLGQLTHKVEKREPIDMKEAESLSRSISTSEAYWTFMYRQYETRKDFENALRCVNQAKCYTSVPSVYFCAFGCYNRLGRTEEGILQIETVREMLPMNLTAKSVLLQWYECQGDTLAIHCMAQEILNTPVKVKNAKSEAIRMKAKGRVRCNE